MVQGSGLRVWNSGFRVEGVGFGVEGVGCLLARSLVVRLCRVREVVLQRLNLHSKFSKPNGKSIVNPIHSKSIVNRTRPPEQLVGSISEFN